MLHLIYDSTDEVAACKRLLEKVEMEGYQVMMLLIIRAKAGSD